MSQLQVTGEAKIRDIQGPVVANSGVITALDGAASQYVRGDGTLADFPTSTGGGSSVSYYLNSSVSQGTIGGVAYRELSKEPIIGAGTDIAISSNGYVASYLTDANDPDVLSIPGGNFNCEFYFSVNNNTGNPFFYAELYKYDGTTFTLIGSSVGVPEYINQGTVINPYYFAIPVPTTPLALTDRFAIRIYVNVDGRTVTLHTENGHLCQVVTTLSKGMVSLNNLTDQSQNLTTGTSGTNFAIVSSGDTHTFNLPIASATNTGKLSSTDWSTFNNKQAALSFTAPLNNTSNTISIPAATSLVDGYLDNLDWVKFDTAYNRSLTSAAVTGTTTKTLTLNKQDGGTITASWTDDNTDAVTSVFGRTGAVVATSGDYNTSQVTELTNLYFTDARSRAALSFTAGSGAYNSTTGVITIPTNTNQLTNGASFITLASLSAGTGITYNNTTGVITNSAPDQTVSLTQGAGISISGTYPSFTIASTITQYTDALARAAISLTTTGTSGAATYNSTTGVFNIPNYTPDLSGYVTIGTTQTITGTKTFSEANRQESGLLLKNNVIAGLAGYTSLGGATNGLAIQLSGSSSIQTLIFQSAAAYSYTLPATSGTIALTSNISYPVTSVFGRTGAIVAVSGDYNTDLVTEGITNLYFTNARSRSAISLTVTGTSGPASYNSTTGVLNVPQYSTDLSGYVTIATTQTITGNKTFSEATRQESGLLLKNGVLAGATGYASLGGASNGLVVQLSGSANQQTLIFQSGAAYSYTLPATSGTLALTSQLTSGTVTSVGLSSATSGVTIGSTPITTSGTITLAIATASGSQNGLLSSTDWTTFNNKQNALTNPVTGTGTTNYLPKFTGASTIGNSVIQESSGNIGIGVTPTYKLDVRGSSGAYWNGSTYTGGTPLAISITNTEVGGYDPVLIFQQTDSGGTSKNSGGIGIVGRSSWTSGNNSTQISDMYFLVRNDNGGISERMRLTSSGNLGLGVTPSDTLSYGRALDIQGTAGSALYVRSGTNSSTVYGLFSYDNNTVRTNIGGIGTGNYLRFISGGSEAMRLNASGNLAVGTTTDAGYKLDVNGTGRFTGLLVSNSTDTYPEFRTSPSDADVFLGFSNTGDGNNAWGIGRRNTGEFWITNFTGNFNSGTRTTVLSLASTGAATFSAATSAITLTTNGAANQWTSKVLANSTSGQSYGLTVQAGTNSSDIGFQVIPVSGTGALLYVRGDGNVGIGTTSPSYRLDVNGTNGSIGVYGSGYTVNPTPMLIGLYTSSIGYIQVPSSGRIDIWNGATGAIATFYNNSNVQFNGNVLVGTGTDSGQKLQVNGTASFSSSVTINGLLTNYNTFNTRTASYTLVLSDASKIIETNVSTANTVTVPTNASVAFPIGTEITIMQYGAGNTTIVAASGVTFRSKDFSTRIGDQYTGATLIKRDTNEWYLIGNIQP